jgi:selenocysteine-specific elongation factor
VIDAHPLAHSRSADTRSWLKKIAAGTPPERLTLRIERRGVEGISFDELAREMGLVLSATRELTSTAIDRGEILIAGNGVLVSRDAFSRGVDVAIGHLQAAGVNGLKLSELQSRTGLPAGFLNAVVERLVIDGKCSVRNEVVMIAGSGPRVSDKDANALRIVLALCLEAGLAPPTVREAAQQLRIKESEMRRLITLLLREKQLVRMGSDDTFVHAETLRQLGARLATMRGGTIDVAGFKALTGLTRKHAIPLLEYLDRERITRKQGDIRIIL